MCPYFIAVIKYGYEFGCVFINHECASTETDVLFRFQDGKIDCAFIMGCTSFL